jgi:hypothetical protein
VIVPTRQLQEAIAHLRSIGGTHTSVIPVRYAFMPQSPHYQELLKKLKGQT